MTTDLTARLDADTAHAQQMRSLWVAGWHIGAQNTDWLLARLGERDAALRAVLDVDRTAATEAAAKASWESNPEEKRWADLSHTEREDWRAFTGQPAAQAVIDLIRAAVVSALSGGAE